MTAPRRRDRHGRGLRGRPLPPGLPGWRSRRDVFDDLVLAAVAGLAVEVVVEDVPPDLPAPEGLVADGTAGGDVPLARVLPEVPRLVVYRRPIELRAEDLLDLKDLLREVVADAAEQLGLDPGQG